MGGDLNKFYELSYLPVKKNADINFTSNYLFESSYLYKMALNKYAFHQ